MINRINTLRTVAKNITSHLCMEGKTKITKPAAIIPGAVAAAGVVVTLETKNNIADIVVKKDDAELQRATFNYNETPNGYELVTAASTYFYDDSSNCELKQSHYLIEPDQEKIYENSINYANAPLQKTTRTYIDKINSSVAQAAGYQSSKIDYDPEENHTYGKKSLQRDIPALLKLLEIIAPDSEFTLKMKDKLKKDKKTSLVAFEATDTKNKTGIVKGFMSANGDSVSYHIDTEGMTIIGEQSADKNLSKAYLKPVKSESKTTKTSETKQNKSTSKSIKIHGDASVKKSAADNTTGSSSKKVNNNGQKALTGAVTAEEPKIQVKHVLTAEYYTNIIFETAMNKNLSTRKKVEVYKDTLASAYMDGYKKEELENILLANGLLEFSPYCRKRYVEDAITLTINNDVKKPVKTLDIKIKELQKTKINTEDEALKDCLQNMVKILSGIQIDSVKKEAYVDKALNLLNNVASENYVSDLLSFIREVGGINDEMKLHYEIYEETVNNKKVKELKSQIESMINNLSDIKHHKKRGEFLTQLYIAKELKELELLQNAVQNLLNEQFPQQLSEKSTKDAEIKKLSISDLSNTNQKIVKKLMSCKSPKTMVLTFEEVRNLLEDIGFTETNVSGSHHKFIAPIEINFNGQRQCFLSICARGTKSDNPALIDDLIRVCRQYYGSEK